MTAAGRADLRVLAFDVFGTVVDWRSGVAAELAAIAQQRNLSVDGTAVAEAWRKRARALLDRVSRGEMPWCVLDEMHRSALDEIVGDFSLEELSDQDRQRLVLAWHHLPPWPDAVNGLSRLRERYVISTLSNGGMAHLIDVVRSARLPFDCILSTELLKTYKPDPRTYQLVPALLRVRPEQVMMVASHMYDLSAAAEQGFRTAFVRRPQEWSGAKSEVPDATVDIVADDFMDLAARLDSQ